jgi:RNA 3'-terminal phosphate cyclase (ATP)
MDELIRIDGGAGSGSGQLLRAALALSIGTGQGFEMVEIRPRHPRPGLEPHHVATVRALALVCEASVGGVFDGSPELRFEPGAVVRGGSFRFELARSGAATLLGQTVATALGFADSPSELALTGPTHLPASPPFHYLARHWAALVAKLGLDVAYRLERAGFHPPAGGEHTARVEPWRRPGSLDLEERGELVSITARVGVARLGDELGARIEAAVRHRLWETRRLEAEWHHEVFPSASPGAFVLLEAVFERGRAAWCQLSERGGVPEQLGDRVARRLLAFLEGEASVDACAADQLVVPLALAGGGGRFATPALTPHLLGVVETAQSFGIPVRVEGRSGGPGTVEIERC